MKKQDGKTPLQLILTIAILVIVVGVSVAMIFEGTDIVSDIRALIQDTKTEETNKTEQNIQEVEK